MSEHKYEHEHEHELAAPAQKKPHLKKIRTRGLNATAPRGGRPPLSSRTGSSRATTSSACPTARSLTGRTWTFEDGFGTGASSLMIHSAPVRTIRRLPAVPVLPMPASAAPVPGSSSSMPMLTTSFSAGRSRSTRVRRPLPCPPSSSSSNFGSASTATTSTSTASRGPPTERPRARVVRPLPVPVPVLKVEPLMLVRPAREAASLLSSNLAPSRPQGLSTLISPSQSPPPPPLPVPSTPGVCVSGSHAGVKTSGEDVQRAGVASGFLGRNEKWGGGVTEEEKKGDITHPQDHKRISVILWKGHHRSLDSIDSGITSEDDEELVFSNMVLKDAPRRQEKRRQRRQEQEEREDQERNDDDNLVDYTWMLSNRVLYRQGDVGRDPQFSGKWVREKKGKRVTEVDYEKILRALRTL